MLGDSSSVKPLVCRCNLCQPAPCRLERDIGSPGRKLGWPRVQPRLEVWRFMLGGIYPLWPEVCVPSQCPSVGLPFCVFYR